MKNTKGTENLYVPLLGYGEATQKQQNGGWKKVKQKQTKNEKETKRSQLRFSVAQYKAKWRKH